MTESELQREIEKLCDKLGLLWWHDNYSLRNKPGLPDLIIVGHTVLWVELKSNTGSMKPAQRMWRNDLNSAGQEYRLWYPRDLHSGEIAKTLEWLATKPVQRPFGFGGIGDLMGEL